MQPTKFLCLTLKMLQIQPEDELVDELVANEDFKYVRALGAFYKRLSGRPADIYESLEPLYRDYRKLRYRQVTEWALVHMDEFIHSLLTEERVCGIALPRLPQRSVLVEAGYLEDPRPTALAQVLDDGGPQAYLLKKVQQGSVAAKALYEHRQKQRAMKEQEQQKQQGRGEKRPREEVDDKRHDARHSGQQRSEGGHLFDEKHHSNGNYQHHQDSYRGHDTDSQRMDRHGRRDRERHTRDGGASQHQRDRDCDRDGDTGYLKRSDERGYGAGDGSDKQRRKDGKRESKHDKKRYGSLFKTEKEEKERRATESTEGSKPLNEGSNEYWDDQRAKLGLKPLK